MPRTAGLSAAEAKKKVIEAVGTGLSIAAATKAAGRSVKTHDTWRSGDKEYAAAIDAARSRVKKAKERGQDEGLYNLSFADWRMRFLGMETYPHQQQWIDILEGREPADLHAAVTYRPGRATRVLINTPPNHAKSTTITMQYVTYCLCMNPNYRVIIVSKTQEQAKKFLYTIRQYLTSSMYAELQAAYGPADGFKDADSGAWTQNKIYLAGRDSGEKDPSVEALGIGGQIYGARADLIVLDDAVTLGNAGDFERQFLWLTQEVATRLSNGKLLVVGTRVAPTDLYSYLMDDQNYLSGNSPWTYLGQPAVLEFDDDPENWVTQWPRSNRKYDENDEPLEDGSYRAQDGPRLNEMRDSVSPGVWALVFMQQAIADDATFHPICVRSSVDKRRKPGPLRPGEWGGRRGGMEGVHVIGSIDPAGTGEAFILVMAIDRQTREYWVLNCWMRSGASNMQWYADLIEQVTPEYSVNEWVVEKNAYASWLIHDQRIVNYCRERGVRISEHYTGRNKQDPEFGVATMASLFGSMRRHVENGRLVHNDDNMIHIPNPDKAPPIQALLEQLMQWQPGRLGRQLRQDGPMALWFATLRARDLLGYNRTGAPQNFVGGRFLTRRQHARQMVLPNGSYQAMVATNGR